MDLDALKELARTAYRKEYIKKQPLGRVENAIFGTGFAAFGFGCLAVIGGLGMLAFGAAAAGPVLLGGFFATAVFGLPVMALGGSISQDKAIRALEQDIENGTLVARFQREILLQRPSNDTSLQPSPVGNLEARGAFSEATVWDTHPGDNAVPVKTVNPPKPFAA